jgi:isoleucyl-tRNA synthetase
MDRLYCDLAAGLPEDEERFAPSVHLADFPVVRTEWIDVELERRMALAQQLSSLVLGLRKREKLRVRQPLRRIMVPALTEDFRTRLASIESWVLGEVNVKELQILKDGEGGIVKRIKPDFKALGPKCGKHMKEVAAALQQWGPAEISALEATGTAQVSLPGGGGQVEVLLSEVAILTDDIPGWTVASEGGLTVALDVHIDEELRAEGLTRELVNRVQNLRKDAGLEVTDRIRLEVEAEEGVCRDLERNLTYLRTEVLADEVCWTAGSNAVPVDLGDGIQVGLMITKLN